MGYSNETPNYHLPQYLADDRPSYLGDWNEAMGVIDSGLQENKSDISDVDTKVVNLTTRVENTETDIDAVPALGTRIDDETVAREAADTALGTRIDDETVAREAADTALTPTLQNDISAVPETQTRVEYNNGKQSIVYDAAYAVNWNSVVYNPLPILYATSAYREATNIKYGNDYTATNLNSDYSDWEPARNHPDTDGKLHIDCTTFAVLVAMGIFYSDSTYTASGRNAANNNFLNMFTDAMKNYIGYESKLVGLEEVEHEHRRILANELAKMLFDAGHLVEVPAIKIVNPGDFLFLSNTASPSHWGGIGHCMIYCNRIGKNHIVIDCSTNRGGANNAVNYHVLTETEMQQIKYKFSVPQWQYPIAVPFLNELRQASISTTEFTQAFPQAGSVNVHNTTTSPKSVTIKQTYPDPVGALSHAISLSSNQSIIVICPPGVKFSCKADSEGVTCKAVISPHGLAYEPYIP